MSLQFRSFALALAFSFVGLSADAAIVAIGGTGSTGAGGFTSNIATTDTGNGAYFNGLTTPESDWVWANDPLVEFGDVVFTFVFDLTGYDLSTAALAGLWGVDNSGRVELNGAKISELFFGYPAFQTLTAFSDAGATLNAGVNELKFFTTNSGGPGGFRASVTVTAEPSAVPLPSSLPLLGGVAMALAGFGLRRKRTAAE